MKKILSVSLTASLISLSCANENNKEQTNSFRSLNLHPVSATLAPEVLEMKYFADRRARLFEQIPDNSVVVLPSHSEIISSYDQNYSFRQDSNFYYMTGFNEPDSVAVLVKNGQEHKFILFVRPNDPLREQWNGYRAGLEGAKTQYLADESYEFSDFDTKILEILNNQDMLYFDLGSHKEYDTKAISWLEVINNPRTRINSKPLQIASIGNITLEMRLIKDDYEQYLIEKASKISAAAHTKVMQAALTANHEYELEAEFRYETAKFGATKQSYEPIVGAGRNTTVLHYIENDADIQRTDLVLIDAGAEYMNYATDITRTFPASGKFSEEQKQIYNIVLKAQLAGIEQIKPGHTYDQMNKAILPVLVEGLVEVGLLDANGKSVEQLIEENAYRPFYMHSCCHWVGLDVHDPSSQKVNGKFRELKPGMVLTVEPGLYINDTIKDIDSKWINIGVRIEDTVLVTEDGYKILTKDVPKQLSEVEQVVSGQ